MSQPPATRRPPRLPAPLDRVPFWAWALAVSAIAYVAASRQTLAAYPEISTRFAPSMAPILRAEPVIQGHIACAVTAFLIGLVILALPKGRGWHKPLGWIWVTAMAGTALSSFFIREIFGNSMSPIHALSAWTVVVLPMGIAAIRRRNIAAHRKHMTGAFLGGMLIAGLFTFLPGRLMWFTLFGG
jgi:uncharacterized membrane protein